MNRISRNISIIVRAEQSIARRRMAVLRNQSGLMVFAGMIAVVGIIMLNVAGFYELSVTMTPQKSAFIVALVDMCMAVALVVAATRMSAAKDVQPVEELRDMAIGDLEVEIQSAVDEVRDMGNSVRRMARDPLGSLLPSVIAPLLASLIIKPKG
jgi:HAMP domain-containing protein